MTDEDQLKALIYTYSRGLDRLDPQVVRSVFSEDAHLDYGPYVGSADGFCEMAIAALSKLRCTSHNMTNILLSIEGDRASGETYGICFHGAARDQAEGIDYVAYVRYIDSFERRDGAWKITHRRLVRDARQVFAPDHDTPATVMKAEVSAGRRDRQDVSYAVTPRLPGA